MQAVGIFTGLLICMTSFHMGHAADGAVIEALHYKPEGREIDSRWCHWNFLLT
jgi:hypothetical protein